MLQRQLIKSLLLASCLWPIMVTAAPPNTCTVGVTPISFGNYNVFSSTNLDASSTVTVNCSPGNMAYTISLDGGLNGSPNNRTMRSSAGNDTLSYNLYTDASRSIIWGNGSGNGVTVSNNSPSPITIYGRVPAAQNAQVGSYNDTVTVTVNF